MLLRQLDFQIRMKTPQVPFHKVFLKKSELEIVSRPHFVGFFDKIFSFVILHNSAKFHTRPCLPPKLYSKIYYLFHAWVIDDAMKFEILAF